MFDVAIVGAGINGCSVAYELQKMGKKVLLFDADGIAGGGSGAAGAFISPKFSKSGELKEILHDAFIYSMEFYQKNFPELFTQAQLLHIAQNERDAEILKIYKKKTSLKLLPLESNLNESLSIMAGIVDAKGVCEALGENAQFIQERVETFLYDNGIWTLNKSYMAKEVVFATGAYTFPLKEPYIKLRGVWGHRIDITTSTQNPYSIHQFVSISPSKDGTLAIGATHNVHYHPQHDKEPYDIEAGREELLEKALRTITLNDIKITKDYMGLRSGSFDYIPLVGPLVDSLKTVADTKIHFQVKKADYTQYSYYPHVTMINGSGGYGFVLAPYLANILARYIVEEREIERRLLPARFFARWAKRL